MSIAHKQTNALAHTKNTRLINAASFGSAIFEIFTRETSSPGAVWRYLEKGWYLEEMLDYVSEESFG